MTEDSAAGTAARSLAGSAVESDRAAIAIFAKAPVPGRVKTRLTPPLTAEEAARVASASIEDTLRLFVPEISASWTLYLDGDPDAALRTLARERNVAIVPQIGADLGERLDDAFRALRGNGARLVLAIGSDSPTLDPAVLRDAVSALHSCDIVLGPAEDGGYYLIGMSGAHEALFMGIPWSTDLVLERTLELARERKLAVTLLPRWYDLDDLASLRRAHRERLEARVGRMGGGATPSESALGRVLDELQYRLGLDR